MSWDGCWLGNATSDSFGRAAGECKTKWSLFVRSLTRRSGGVGMILAENGGLDVELEPDGVLGNWWNAGA